MFFGYILAVVSLVVCLHDFSVFSCEQNCADSPVFTPSKLVVKYRDPISVSCSVCQDACQNKTIGLDKGLGDVITSGTTLTWKVDTMTEWDITTFCYYNNKPGHHCCSILPVIVYQPPDNVSISFVHTEPMVEGHEYTLQCTVQDVAPVRNLSVTFYRGQTALGTLRSKNTQDNKPVTEIFTLNIRPTKEDDGGEYWCKAELDLGPEGPQPPPVVMSQNITATVFYKPQLKGSPHPDPIVITQWSTLQLDCSAVGNPSPSYTWKLPSNELLHNSSSVFTISSVTSVNSGEYTCNVTNRVGTVTVKFKVDVQPIYIYIIVGLAAVLVLVILGGIIYIIFKRRRMGHYNLKDIFKLHTKHSAVPTEE